MRPIFCDRCSSLIVQGQEIAVFNIVNAHIPKVPGRNPYDMRHQRDLCGPCFASFNEWLSGPSFEPSPYQAAMQITNEAPPILSLGSTVPQAEESRS